jgi:hypothetical protein
MDISGLRHSPPNIRKRGLQQCLYCSHLDVVKRN